ncbi:signal peptidase I [Algimonas porphyrae]
MGELMSGTRSQTQAAMAPSSPETGKSLLARLIEEIRFFTKLAIVMLALLTFVWGHYKIPSESMQPTLEVGDHLYVSKFAYGYSRHSLPLGLHNLPLPDGKFLSRLPKRGDIVVFRNPNNGVVMIKRAIGLPGDEVQLLSGRLYINGALIPREPRGDLMYRMNGTFRDVIGSSEYDEYLPGDDAPHRIWERTDMSEVDNTSVYVVPQGHLFFMGDNRERSTDSRLSRTDMRGNPLRAKDFGPGFVPLDHVIGRADILMFTLNRCDRSEGLRCPERGRAPSRL